MEIKSISQKIFRTSSNRTESNNHTNPFGVSFKGNIINADVFEEKSPNENQNKGKMFVSTLVGSMNSAMGVMGRRLNSVVSFGMRMKETTTQLWDRTRDRASNINMAQFLTSRMPAFTGTYSIRRLQERDVSELRTLFEEKLEEMNTEAA